MYSAIAIFSFMSRRSHKNLAILWIGVFWDSIKSPNESTKKYKEWVFIFTKLLYVLRIDYLTEMNFLVIKKLFSNSILTK